MKRAECGFGLLVCLVVLAGCGQQSRYSKNEQVLHGIAKLRVIDPTVLAIGTDGGGSSSGLGAKLAQLHRVAELVSVDGSTLPPDLAEDVREKIRSYLLSQGCTVTGCGSGGGIHYTDNSGVQDANTSMASLSYSLHGAKAKVDVIVIERDYQWNDRQVVGQLIILVNEGR